MLALRVALAGAVAAISAPAVWYTSAVIVVPLLPDGDVAVAANLVCGMGLGAGVAGWLIGIRMGSDRLPRRIDLPLAVAVAVVSAWLGQAVLDDLFFKSENAVLIQNTPDVYTALMGSVIGAMIVPLIMGAWRVAHRLEP